MLWTGRFPRCSGRSEDVLLHERASRIRFRSRARRGSSPKGSRRRRGSFAHPDWASCSTTGPNSGEGSRGSAPGAARHRAYVVAQTSPGFVIPVGRRSNRTACRTRPGPGRRAFPLSSVRARNWSRVQPPRAADDRHIEVAALVIACSEGKSFVRQIARRSEEHGARRSMGRSSPGFHLCASPRVRRIDTRIAESGWFWKSASPRELKRGVQRG